MTRTISSLLVLAGALACAGCSGGGPTHVNPNAFVWSGTVAPGGTVHIRNIDGPILVDSSGTGKVEITASARWRGSRGPLRFAEAATSDGIVVCTLYSSDGRCDEHHYETSRRGVHLWSLFGGNNGHARVAYVLRVPHGVQVDVMTVNGELGVANVEGAVEAHTVNGSVRVAAGGGAVSAETVNGSVTAALDSVSGTGAVKLSTVNGSVTAELPSSLNGTISMETVTGHATSDFPLTAKPDDPKHLSGTIGTGGRSIELSTINGSVTLRKGS